MPKNEKKSNEILKISQEEYIRNLEIALIFLCECYTKAEEAVGCRETGNKSVSNKYSKLWFNFPMIQGSFNKFAISDIGSLRTILGNREENTMSFRDIFDKMHNGRITEREFSDRFRNHVNKNNNK